MSRRLENLLFQGETVEGRTTLGGSELAVTTHRVLVFTPDAEGRTFDHADCPNVRGATVETSGNPRYRDWMVRSAVYGLAMLSGGYVIDRSVLSSLLGDAPSPSGAAAVGMGILDTVTAILGMLSGLLLVSGVAAIVAAAILFWRYSTSHSRELVIEIASRDPIRIPVTEAEGENAEALLAKWL